MKAPPTVRQLSEQFIALMGKNPNAADMPVTVNLNRNGLESVTDLDPVEIGVVVTTCEIEGLQVVDDTYIAIVIGYDGNLG